MPSLATITRRPLFRALAERYFNARFRSGRLRMVFICGHMRSGSSLLVHILNSSREIIGFGETHRVYHGPQNFGGTAVRVYTSFNRLPSGERYVLDKVLHDHLMVDAGILGFPGTRTIFLLRPPEETFPSIARLVWYAKHSVDDLRSYYLGRLRWISEAAARLDPATWTHLRYRDLVEAPEPTLEHIRETLELRSSLSPRYETMWSTGRYGIGDPSSTIQEGVIVRKPPSAMPPELEPIVGEAREAFDRCCEHLARLKPQADPFQGPDDPASRPALPAFRSSLPD